MQQRVAVVLTDSDDQTAPILVAKRFKYEVVVLHHPSIGAIAGRAPDLVLIDWSPGAIKRNTSLVHEVRSVAATRDVPILIFCSDESDVSKAMRSTERVFVFEIPQFGLEQAVERALQPFAAGKSSNMPALAEAPSPTTTGSNPVHLLLRRFHAVALQLQARHAGRQTLKIDDEYDVQDLLHSLLRIFFDDVRPEEWSPSYAGKSSRVDFLLKDERIVIEVKMTRPGLGAREVGDQLIIDMERYRKLPDCRHLICFVYDPGCRIANPVGFERDLNRDEGDLKVEVVVLPKSC